MTLERQEATKATLSGAARGQSRLDARALRTLKVVVLVTILVAAAWFRLRHLDWDDYNHYHPDERFISWVATSIEWPSNLATAFAPHESSLNPYYWPEGAASPGVLLPQGEQRRFAYGHLPLYLGVAATRLAERFSTGLAEVLPEDWLLTRDLLNARGANEFRHITAVGRLLSGLIDVATVALTFILGRALFGTSVGFLAAALLLPAVLHIQLAHFFAFDPFLTFFALASLTFMVLAVEAEGSGRARRNYWLLAAVSVGLAIGSKFTGVLLLLPLVVAIWLSAPAGRNRRALLAAALIGLALLVFAATNPFAIIDWTCQVPTAAISLGPLEVPQLNLGSCYLLNLTLQGSMVRGMRDVPFVRQYAGTTPYLYFLEMQLKWGLGPILGLVAFGGFGREVIRLLRGMWQAPAGVRASKIGAPHLIVMSWTLPFFLTTGALDVKFMRYLQPLIPFVVIYGAAWLASIANPRLRAALGGLTLAGTGLYALAFMNIYSTAHPWSAASAWMYDNLPEETVIAVEEWDDSLPQRLEMDGQVMQPSLFRTVVVNWLSGTEAADSPQKLKENLAQLARADYLVVASNRNYGVIPRLPKRYPLSSQYYQLLFSGALGYEAAYVDGREPNLLGLRILPDSFSWPGLEPPEAVEAYLESRPALRLGRFDESFTVYDQPLVMIFANEGRLSTGELLAQFDLPSNASASRLEISRATVDH